jgi:hypothetical protein
MSHGALPTRLVECCSRLPWPEKAAPAACLHQGYAPRERLKMLLLCHPFRASPLCALLLACRLAASCHLRPFARLHTHEVRVHAHQMCWS